MDCRSFSEHSLGFLVLVLACIFIDFQRCWKWPGLMLRALLDMISNHFKLNKHLKHRTLWNPTDCTVMVLYMADIELGIMVQCNLNWMIWMRTGRDTSPSSEGLTSVTLRGLHNCFFGPTDKREHVKYFYYKVVREKKGEHVFLSNINTSYQCRHSNSQ